MLQVMLKASNIVPLAGAMAHCRGLAPVGATPTSCGNRPVGGGVAGSVREWAPKLVVRTPLLLLGNMLAGLNVVGLVNESTLRWGLRTVMAVGCINRVFRVYFV